MKKIGEVKFTKPCIDGFEFDTNEETNTGYDILGSLAFVDGQGNLLDGNKVMFEETTIEVEGEGEGELPCPGTLGNHAQVKLKKLHITTARLRFMMAMKIVRKGDHQSHTKGDSKSQKPETSNAYICLNHIPMKQDHENQFTVEEGLDLFVNCYLKQSDADSLGGPQIAEKIASEISNDLEFIVRYDHINVENVEGTIEIYLNK